MSFKPTPIVNSASLAQHPDQTVRIYGKVLNAGSTLQLQASDLGHVDVSLSPDSSYNGSAYVEVIGKCQQGSDGLALKEFNTIGLGDKFDLNLVEHVISLSRHLPALFTDSDDALGKMEE